MIWYTVNVENNAKLNYNHQATNEKSEPKEILKKYLLLLPILSAQPSRSGSKIGGALVHNEMRTSLFYSLDFSPVENIARL